MKRRLLLLINSLEGGGAESVMSRLAAGLADLRPECEIALALLDDLPRAYEVPPGVELIQLDSRGSFARSIVQVATLVRSWQPDVVLSFLTRANCAALLARGQAPCRCVISERIHTTSHLGNSLRGRVLRRVVRRLYPRADAVVAVSRGVADDLEQHYRVPAARLSVIANPVDAPALRQRAEDAPEIALPDDFFVSVGRLVPNKGGEILLRAFANHCNKARSLVMLGEGPERQKLTSLIGELGLEGRVILPGYVGNPHAIVGRATAYLSASRSEGFPNALVEAMALGRPVAVTDCPSGPSEIVNDIATPGEVASLATGLWGLLSPVDGIDDLTAAMNMLDDIGQRQDYGARAADRAESYSGQAIVQEYARVLQT